MYRDMPPLVYHERYSAEPWPEKHSFPMSKFADLAKLLSRRDGPLGAQGPAAMEAVFRPTSQPPEEWFVAVHDPEYYRAFIDGTLDEKAVRRCVCGCNGCNAGAFVGCNERDAANDGGPGVTVIGSMTTGGERSPLERGTLCWQFVGHLPYSRVAITYSGGGRLLLEF